MAPTHGNYRAALSAFLIGVCLSAGMSHGAIEQRSGRGLSTRALRTMARAYMAYGRYDQARPLAEQAAMEAVFRDADIGEQAMCLIDLATVYSHKNMLEDAEALFDKGLSLQKEAIGRQHPYTAHTLRMLSDVYRRQNKLDAAEDALGEAFSVMLAHTKIQSREMTPFLIAAAQLAYSAGRFEHALKTYQTAEQMALVSYGPDHLYTAQVMQGTAQAAMACGDLDAARDQMAYSLQLQERFFGRDSAMLIDGWLTQARIERADGAPGKSEVYLQKAIAAAQLGRNVVTLARVYEQVNAIRRDAIYTARAESL